MAERKPPVLDTTILCSEVVYDGNDLVFALNEPLHTVVVMSNDAGELEAPEFFLFVQMSDWEAQGSYEFNIEVRSETGIIIAGSPESGIRVTFASHYYPFHPLEHAFALRGMVFPHPGVYHFHVMCGLASMSERGTCAKALKLIVVRGEPGDPL